MSFTSTVYALLRLNNDLKAIRKGPRAVAKRAARKAGYRLAAKIINRAVR